MATPQRESPIARVGEAARARSVISSLHELPGRVGQEQADGRFPALAICRGGLSVTGPSDRSEFVLAHHDGQHDFTGRELLTQHSAR